MNASTLALAPNDATSRPIGSDVLLDQLRWRYSTRKFDAARKIPETTWRAMEEALVLAPSSYGLQPWKFFVVDDPELRAKLAGASWGQRQVADASHVVVFAVRTGLSAADVERHIARIAQVRGVEPSTLDGWRRTILRSVEKPAEQVEAWSTRQVYLALGQFLTAAALLGIDACPMEGFEHTRHDERLGLREQGYRAVVVATAGYRSSDDPNAAKAKVRFEHEQVIAHVA